MENPFGTNTNAELPQQPFDYADGVTSYLQKGRKAHILRPHQVEVFEDFVRFFTSGEKRGYINLPTGTGKTVLFVELSKALLEAHEGDHKPRILVVTPTKDLVHQTLGRTEEKGFGHFAPELNVGSYFSDSTDDERLNLDSFDVVVTTYRSFEILSRQNEYRSVTDSERPKIPDTIKAVPSGRKLLDKFDVIMLDEAHHSLGETTRGIISRLPPEKVLIGFTATPDIDDYAQLTGVLPNKIHELELNEAIYMGLLAPIASIGIRSGVKIRGSNIYDENGEFIDSRIGYLAEDPNRNQQIVKIAKALAEQGVGTIISCIAGGEAWHARYLAQQLNASGVRATSVHSRVPAEERQSIYHQFNNGDIDVLTFIGVLGEGWDSHRAKGLINARPTRSNIFSKQRLGRITRPGATAFAVDIYDEFEDQNLPITVADVINEGVINYGSVIGSLDDEVRVAQILESISNATPNNIMSRLEGTYRERAQYIAELERLFNGKLYDDKGNAEYATATALNSNYQGLTEEIVTKYEEIYGVRVPKKQAAQGKSARTVYSVKEANRALYALPEVDPSRYFIDRDSEKWIAPEGVVKLFRKRYPGVNSDVIAKVFENVGGLIDWIPVKYTTTSEKAKFRHYSIIKMYHVTEETIDALNTALAEYYSQSES